MTLEYPSDPKLAVKIVEANSQRAASFAERGVLGVLFGMTKEKPGNIAGFSIIVSCTMILIVSQIDASPDFPKKELINLFASIIPTALGFLFGNSKHTD